MKIEKVIRLMDGSLHTSKQQAERRLLNVLSSGQDLKFFEGMAHKKTLEIRDYLIKNSDQLNKTIQVINELKQVLELKNI